MCVFVHTDVVVLVMMSEGKMEELVLLASRRVVQLDLKAPFL